MTIYALGIGLTGVSALFAVAGHGQMNTPVSSNEPKAGAVVDATGTLRVPDAYRTTYEFLGSWAVAADQGQGSKDVHVVCASPGPIAAHGQGRRSPAGT